MKKATVSFILAFVLVFAVFIPGAAQEKKGVNIVFILDNASVRGCAESGSLFDRVADVAVSSGKRITVLFDADMNYNGDYASALMKACSAGMFIGVYDGGRTGPDERIRRALMYQKYVIKSSSRLVGAGSEGAELYGDEYCVYKIDIMVLNSSIIERLATVDAESLDFAMKIDADMISVATDFIKNSGENDLYMISPTEYGTYSDNGGDRNG